MAKTKVYVEEPSLQDKVSEHYKKFFDKFNDIEHLPPQEWKVVHLLGYLCKKYKDYYGLDYSFRFNNPAPSRSYEVFQIKKLSNMLSSNPEILKNYLDWVFDNKIIEKKKRITSLGYFTHPDIVNEYKFKFLFKKQNSNIVRTDQLPQNVAEICSKYGFDIKTYAELAFIKKMPNQERLFEELKNMNFNTDLLDKIA